MDLGISGRIGLVAASGRGLGKATAERLAMEGVQVAICDKDESVLDLARSQVEAASKGGKVCAYNVDLTNESEIEQLIDNIHQDLGLISILVTNSGGPPAGDFVEATDEKWFHAYQLTFLSCVRLIRLTLPDMKAQKWGRIINFTSRALKEPIPGLIISNAVRLAVAGMAKTLASEVAEFSITVNNICPGPTSTERAIELASRRARKKGISLEEELTQTANNIPMGRLARPEEPASAAAFLASELAGYITGISILVDGGAVRAL
jgi:3-oxoacyl-[acyl-carrier protein] reductase